MKDLQADIAMPWKKKIELMGKLNQ